MFTVAPNTSEVTSMSVSDVVIARETQELLECVYILAAACRNAALKVSRCRR